MVQHYCALVHMRKAYLRHQSFLERLQGAHGVVLATVEAVVDDRLDPGPRWAARVADSVP
jgi:hypothetical protein